MVCLTVSSTYFEVLLFKLFSTPVLLDDEELDEMFEMGKQNLLNLIFQDNEKLKGSDFTR